MKIKCPKCGQPAFLEDKFEYIDCPSCGLKVSYAEYIDMVAGKEQPTGSDWREVI